MSCQTVAEKEAELKVRLALYMTAEANILSNGQDYSIGDRSLSRADLSEIRKTIKDLQNQIDRLCNGSGGMTVNYGLPRST
jgi:hypothetical protein